MAMARFRIGGMNGLGTDSWHYVYGPKGHPVRSAGCSAHRTQRCLFVVLFKKAGTAAVV